MLGNRPPGGCSGELAPWWLLEQPAASEPLSDPVFEMLSQVEMHLEVNTDNREFP